MAQAAETRALRARGTLPKVGSVSALSGQSPQALPQGAP